MRLPSDQQDETYSTVWLPLQQRLGAHLEDFFRHEYMRYGYFVRQDDVYQAWKDYLDPVSDDDLLGELLLVDRDAKDYARLVDPNQEPNASIRRRLGRLNRWGAQTLYPFLLHVYTKYNEGAVDASGFVEILRMVESFLVRRLLTGVPTNTLNRLFLRLSSQLPEDLPLVEGIRSVLSEPSRRWPRDAEFVKGIAEFELYLNGRPDQRRLILEALELSYEHKEPVDLDSLTVEHVMPQTLTPEWKAQLGSDAEDIHASYVHVLGNLTLTGYNPELSNRPFAEKRKLLSNSSLAMNREIADAETWDAEAIDARAAKLARRALKIWPGPIKR
jgi:hypothetical protein